MKSMMSLLHKPFSHLYVEQDLADLPLTKEIISRFPDSQIININDYKDLFNRPKQDVVLQSLSKKMVIAKKKGEMLYRGSRMCNDFAINRFYYVSQAMNCPFQCEYCYLQGMYKTSNLVVFLNIEDLFKAIDELEKVPTFIALSYDTDLLAIDSFTHFISRWLDYIASKPEFTFELRTKSCNTDTLLQAEVPANLIISYSLSPEEIIGEYEHHVPDLQSRLKAVNRLMEKGYRIRLAFEPLLPVASFGTIYPQFLDTVARFIPWERLEGISISCFHINHKYLQHLRTHYPDNPIIQFPYQTVDDIAMIDDKNDDLLSKLFIDYLNKRIAPANIFIWHAK